MTMNALYTLLRQFDQHNAVPYSVVAKRFYNPFDPDWFDIIGRKAKPFKEVKEMLCLGRQDT